MDALAISDRFLQNGASDQLLQLLIERGEENISGQSQGHSGNNNWSHSWQYCLRLKDKQLAARLALNYMHHLLFLANLPAAPGYTPHYHLLNFEIYQQRKL
ncbi:hypothetical protein KY284_033233 [Solanum tuberosum]|nr:hypothetical protein KY284_033233 [Solanum tuberosum]